MAHRYKSAIANFRYALTRSICANALDMLALQTRHLLHYGLVISRALILSRAE